MASEKFRPLALSAPVSLAGKLKFCARLFLDLQVATVYQSIREELKQAAGAVLDVGCGSSPYRFLFSAQHTSYTGLDIVDAEKFDYRNSDIVAFDGTHIPFPDASFDAVLCTEVLEHVQHYQTLVDEIHRVLKPGGHLIVTVPWSARFHYIPYDFFRYTPSSLAHMFKQFQCLRITPRGTDITSIIAKLLVIWFRNIAPIKGRFNVLSFLCSVLCSPMIPILAIWGHASSFWQLGSSEDPLGYTVIAIK
ncbi:class I SAM-dependent methyltransferase [Undibacterium sp. RuRC25W]|uniref:class I SAM-dependent methyltransferase n=1 Tax=Undibacterium sp. RuRC25W TaxID=3413047 RepID=UPI003BEFB9F0